MAEASKEDTEVRNIINEDKDEAENNNEEDTDEEGSNVRDVLEKLSDFLTKNNLEKQITDERKKILRKIEVKNEEISQKNETHRHKLCEIHEAYKLEIQKENERHVEDLKVTETSIRHLKTKLEDLQQLNYSISRKIPTTELPSSSNSSRSDQTRVRELLECPVCLEEMKPPKKIFQCSNGHVICELCKNNPEVRSCPTCRVKFRGHNVVRNIVAEKLARSTFETDELSELSPPAPGTRTSTIESNPVTTVSAGPGVSLLRSAVASDRDQDQFHLVGFEPAYGYRRHTPQGQNEDDEEDDDEDSEFLEWARIIGERPESGGQETVSSGNQHRRLGEASGQHHSGARDEFSGDTQQSRDTPTSRDNRDFSGNSRELTHSHPRMRDAQLIRTYRPNPRYLPHHMRRQRTTSQEEPELRDLTLLEQEDTVSGERLFFSRTPRTVRRQTEDINDNLRGYRRVL